MSGKAFTGRSAIARVRALLESDCASLALDDANDRERCAKIIARRIGPLLHAADALAKQYEEAVLECPTEVRVDVHMLYDLVEAMKSGL